MFKESLYKKSRIYQLLLSGALLGSTLFGCTEQPYLPQKTKPINDQVCFSKKESLDSIVSETKEQPKEPIIETQQEVPEDKSKNKKKNIPWTLIWSFAGAGVYFLFRDRKKIKKNIDFFFSLPILSIPGITEEHIYEFIKEYSPKTPDAMLKLVSNQFMKFLPDENIFSPLEMMILVKNVRHNFVSNNDLEFCTGIANIVEKYDRSVLSYEDFLSTVNIVSRENIELTSAAEEIKKSLIKLNESYTKLPVYANKKIYDSLLRKAEKLNKKDNDYDYMVLEEAILINPSRSEAYLKVSGIYEENERFEDAVHVLDELIEQRPCKPVLSEAHLERAYLFLHKSDCFMALQDLIFVNDSDFRKYRVKNRCFMESGDIKSSKEKFMDFVEEFFYCYVKPGLFYWSNIRKKVFSNKCLFL